MFIIIYVAQFIAVGIIYAHTLALIVVILSANLTPKRAVITCTFALLA